MVLWRLGNESVVGGARQVNDPFVAAVRFRRAAVARHYVRVDIDRVNRIGNRDFVLVAENIENKAAIAFRSIRDKNLVIGDIDIAIAIIALRDCRS